MGRRVTARRATGFGGRDESRPYGNMGSAARLAPPYAGAARMGAQPLRVPVAAQHFEHVHVDPTHAF